MNVKHLQFFHRDAAFKLLITVADIMRRYWLTGHHCRIQMIGSNDGILSSTHCPLSYIQWQAVAATLDL